MIKTAILVILLALAPSAALATENSINILYTGALNGELEPCGCSPKASSGGLARLSAFVSANGEAMAPYLLLDAGNSMGEDTPQGRLKSKVILDAFSHMGYSAAAIFDSDMASKPPGVVEGLTLLFASSPDAVSLRGKKGPMGVNISVDGKAAREDFFNILLTEMPVSEAEKLSGWDVVILSSGEKLDEPIEAGGTIIVSGYPRGEKLGVLTLDLTDKGAVRGFSHRWQELGVEMDEDPDVRAMIDEYDSKVAALLKDEERVVPSDKTYLGVQDCALCHRPFVDIWKGTRHSGAFASLEKAGKSKDPECVGCHTTGYSREGGFYSATATPELANVQCEQCHGPGRDHADDYTVAMQPVTEAVCLNCHTALRSPDFDYKSYREKIKHW